MKKLSLIFVVALVCAAFANFYRSPANAQKTVVPVSTFENLRGESFSKLIDLARRDGRAHVIVGVSANFQPEGRLAPTDLTKQRIEIKRAQNDFLNRFQSLRVGGLKQFEYIPYLAFETDAETLERMRNDSLVVSIEEDVVGEAALAQSTQIVGAPAAWANGYSGGGQTVAILDSGVDKNHSFLSGKVISEACYSSNFPAGANPSSSVCPGGATESTASDSGLHCSTTVSGCAHGTNVAGIAAGKGATFSGVARDANIIAIQMFSRFETTTSCGGTAPCALYWNSDLIRALERVKTLSLTMNNISAVNLSLQSSQMFASNCDAAQSAVKAAIDNLRSVGIATIVCSGNFANLNGMSAPACISTAISVGSTDDGSSGTTLNTVSSFSNSSPLLHLLAPGRWINSSIPNNQFQNYSGTSMAAPHVAGALAILRQRKPNATVSQMLNALINSGQPITDSRNGIVKPRIRVDKALAAVSVRPAFDFDGDAKADVSVFRPDNGVWYLQQSEAGFTGIAFGQTGDKIVPADYDGDGKTDVAVFRPSNGVWYLQRSSLGFTGVAFGAPDDIPVPADYDGDGKSDIAVFRPSNGVWYIQGSSVGFSGTAFGAQGDRPVAADYDGDGTIDIAVFRPSNGTWYLQRSNLGFTGVLFGDAADKAVPADYDGDGRADIAVFRPSNGVWYLQQSTAGFSGIAFGAGTDLPVPADYDGDGKADISVFRESNGVWYQQRSTQGFTGVAFGAAGDKPAPNAFVQ